MREWNKTWLLRVIFFTLTLAAPAARASTPPADLCSLISAADLSKIVGQTYGRPTQTVAPAPFPNTATGTDCTYTASSGGKILFRAYVDPSPAAASDLFAKLGAFFGMPTPVTGIGDKAYFDQHNALHALKGQVRFYIQTDAADPKKIEDLANHVMAQL